MEIWRRSLSTLLAMDVASQAPLLRISRRVPTLPALSLATTVAILAFPAFTSKQAGLVEVELMVGGVIATSCVRISLGRTRSVGN